MNELTNKELSSLAYKKVKEMILSNELKAGQKIIQDKLAEDLGISRTPLRRALQMLESEYLVEFIPRRGVIVRSFPHEKIIEVYDCRIALEGIAIRRFTEQATQANIAKLKTFFQPFINKTEINDKKYKEADGKFHDYIIKHCGNDFLGKLFHRSNLLIFMHQIGLVRPASETLLEHLQIIEAISNKNIDLVEKLSIEHLLKSKKLIIQKMNLRC